MDFWENKKVVLTGGSGMLGGTILAMLIEFGADVVCLEHDADVASSASRIVRGDLNDVRSLERLFRDEPVDVVFHLGAQPIVPHAQRYPIQTIETNVLGTSYLLDVIRRSSRVSFPLVVVASTDKVYGRTKEDYHENMLLSGNHQIYEASKVAMESLCEAYRHSYGIPIVTVRCSNIYGPGDENFSRLIPGAIRSALLGESLLIRSDGNQIRDYVYVEDVARGYLLIARKYMTNVPKSGYDRFNFGTGTGTKTIELVERIKAISNTQFKVEIMGLQHAQDEIPSQVMNYEHASSVLGWYPEYDLDQGLRSTISWYRNYFGVFNEQI